MIKALSHSLFICSFSLLLACFMSACGVKRKAIAPQYHHQTLHRIQPRMTELQLDSLEAIYGQNKTLATEFREQTLIALSYFPELKDTPIKFKYSKEATTMAARPAPLSMLYQRHYEILINTDPEFEGVRLEDVPFNAQIGIIGHELTHIVDYQNRNFWGVIGVLFRYMDKHRKPLFEKEIDRATIERGLGWQLYDWAVFAMEDCEQISEEYKEFKRKHYMNPKEIEDIIHFYSKYSITH